MISQILPEASPVFISSTEVPISQISSGFYKVEAYFFVKISGTVKGDQFTGMSWGIWKRIIIMEGDWQ